MSQSEDLYKTNKTQVVCTHGENHKDDLQMTEVSQGYSSSLLTEEKGSVVAKV